MRFQIKTLFSVVWGQSTVCESMPTAARSQNATTCTCRATPSPKNMRTRVKYTHCVDASDRLIDTNRSPPSCRLQLSAVSRYWRTWLPKPKLSDQQHIPLQQHRGVIPQDNIWRSAPMNPLCLRQWILRVHCLHCQVVGGRTQLQASQVVLATRTHITACASTLK